MELGLDFIEAFTGVCISPKWQKIEHETHETWDKKES